MYTYLHVHCTVKLAKIRTVFEAALLLCNGLGKLILVLVVKCQGLSISRCRSLNLIVAIFRPLYYSMYSLDCQRCQKSHNLFVYYFLSGLLFVDAFKSLLNGKVFQSVVAGLWISLLQSFAHCTIVCTVWTVKDVKNFTIFVCLLVFVDALKSL